MCERTKSLKRKCQVDVMNLLVYIRLFPIYMHSLLKFDMAPLKHLLPLISLHRVNNTWPC